MQEFTARRSDKQPMPLPEPSPLPKPASLAVNDLPKPKQAAAQQAPPPPARNEPPQAYPLYRPAPAPRKPRHAPQQEESGTRPHKVSRQRNRLLVFFFAAVAALCLLASDGLLRSAALLSAGLALPQGADSLLDSAAVIRDETKPAAAATSSKTEQVSAKASGFDIQATPKDIQVLMEEAVSEFAKQKRDGDIQSKTYSYKDATHRWGTLTVRNTTSTQANRDISKDLEAPIGLLADKSKPAVLIFHTHSTEGYEIIERPWYAADYSSRTQNTAKSIVRVGEAMAQMLERAGWKVIHDKTIYDKQYTGAYGKSRAAVEKHLKENPSILVTLDVHRDAIHTNNGVRIKPVADINGKKAAQVMIITGTQEGAITGYPDWEENLRFASKLHVAAEKAYPGIMRPIFFAQRKYNMDLTPYSLLLEFGSDVNTLEEAVYSGRLIGSVLADMLDTYTDT